MISLPSYHNHSISEKHRLKESLILEAGDKQRLYKLLLGAQSYGVVKTRARMDIP
jgi:hypothetical protein